MKEARKIEIVVIAKPCKTKDGKQFTAYRAVQNDGRLIDCHFRKVCGVLPEHDFVMTVMSDKINVATNYRYPRLWVSEIVAINEVNTTADATADDLPF